MMYWMKRCGRTAMVVSTVLALVGVGPVGRGVEAALWTEGAGGGSREDPDLSRLNQGLVRLAKSLRPAVVQIGVSGEKGTEPDLPQDHPPLPPGERPKVGSGIILSADGYVLTNQHVIDQAGEIEVQLMDARKFPAKLVGRDVRTDLALLKVEATGLPVLPLGDSDRLEVGELVLAIGNPFGLEHSVSLGIVNRKGRALGSAGAFDDYIQTDASVNPGNSGGPLVNMRGEVIGINTAVVPNRRVAFAIPITLAKSLLPELQVRGRIAWGFLGVSIQDLSQDVARAMGFSETMGALVNNVLSGQPAEMAGIKRGDIIVAFDGKPIPNVRALQRTVSFTAVGKQVELQVFRGGRLETVRVKVGEAATAERRATAAPTRRELGMTVEELDAEKTKKFKLREGEEGLVVSDVAKGGPAASAGIRAGDLIREVNRRQVRSLEGYRTALRREEAEADLFLLQRGEAYVYVAVKPKT
ncbi:MAG: trypsin-like peptidase domain-containing protein [candidate division NC10 bacterium]|nr:trypsin-like peptidase domain-containing protein [candidate division NC10 bacterium]